MFLAGNQVSYPQKPQIWVQCFVRKYFSGASNGTAKKGNYLIYKIVFLKTTALQAN